MAKETILVIEDEEDIQELVRYNLVKEGYRVTLAIPAKKGPNRQRTITPA